MELFLNLLTPYLIKKRLILPYLHLFNLLPIDSPESKQRKGRDHFLFIFMIINRGLSPKHTNSVGLRVETSLSLLWCSVGRSQSNNNKIYLTKDSKYSTIKQSLIEQKHKLWTKRCEGSGGSALGDTLNKALQISLDEYWMSITLIYFRIVSTCC